MKITIYKKLLLGFGLVITLMIAANIYVLWQLSEVTKTTSRTFQNDVRSITLAKQLRTVLLDEERYAEKYIGVRDTTYYAMYVQQTDQFDLLADSLYDASPNVKEIGLLFRLRNGHKWFAGELQKERFRPRGSRLPNPEALAVERSDTLTVLHSLLDQLILTNESDVNRTVTNISDVMIRSSNVAWLIIGGALLVALMVALIITGTIVRPIRVLIKGTENIARGIFDPITVTSRDEMALLAEAVNDMSAKLKQINDLKTEMLHHISHELRTPLQTMLSAQYLLAEQKRGPLNEDQQRLLASMKEGIKKLTVFSNQFLDIQKIEHGSMEYHFVPTKLAEVIGPAVDDAQIVAAQKDVALKYSAEDGLPEIMADPEKISQIFTNLLSNAIKYTESGGTITVTVTKGKKGITASVADTGAGIPKEDLPRIFTKFYQAKNAKKGTGIGLALVKHLVEAHKGRITVESELGKGTTFTVELPSAPAGAKNAEPSRHELTEKLS